MALKHWSTTAASNATADPTINWAENQAPSTVNNSARAEMAAVRTWYEDVEWRDWGHTVTRTGNTTFTIAADVTSIYESGRPIRCTDSSTLYGEVVSSTYSAPNTTVTVLLESGNLSASLSAASLGYKASNRTIPAQAILGGPFGVPINYSLSHSVGSNALTMAIKGRNGQDPSSSNKVLVPFRSSTAANGDFNWVSITGALSLVISSGSTLGHNDGLKQYIYWYLINNSGTAELAASSKFFGMSGIVSTSAEGGAGGADSGTTMYSSSARSNVPFRCIGYTEDTQTTAGTWASAPSTVHLAPFTHPVISFSAHKNGTDQTSVVTSTFTKVTFGTEVYDNGGLFDAATNHRWFPPPGNVRITSHYRITASTDQMLQLASVYKNGTQLRETANQASGTTASGVSISIEDECSGTDYYEIFAWHNAGSDRTIEGDAEETWVMGSWSPGRS